jgi:replicative DNA helicase
MDSLARKIEEAPEYRLAPQNIEAEQALLGAILVNNEAYFRVSGFLKSEHFIEGLHQTIFDTLSLMVGKGNLATPVTIKSFLPEHEKVGDLSVAQYLARLAAEAATIINAEDYGRTIYDLALRRSLVHIGEDMVNIAYDAPVDLPPFQQIEDAERRLFDLAEVGRYEGGFQSFSDALSEAVDMAGAAYERDGSLSGMSTGLADLDRRMGGLQSSDLIILAARPGMGKTALATNIAYNVASAYEGEIQPDGNEIAKNGGRVAFLSLEMSAEQLATRVMAEQTEIPSHKIRRGEISEQQFYSLSGFAREFNSVPLYIDDTGGISIAALTARARRLKRQQGLDLVVVDYLQLLTGSQQRASQGRVQEITEITTSLKALAKELAVPVVALSQLSRQVENRDDKRPQLSDLRESGSIEQDADVVMFIYREEYYLKNKMPAENTEEYQNWENEIASKEGLAEVIIGKQRHGPTGMVELHFAAEVTRFSDVTKSNYLPDRME